MTFDFHILACILEIRGSYLVHSVLVIVGVVSQSDAIGLDFEA